MKKKFAAVLIAVMMAGSVMAGCGESLLRRPLSQSQKRSLRLRPRLQSAGKRLKNTSSGSRTGLSSKAQRTSTSFPEKRSWTKSSQK